MQKTSKQKSRSLQARFERAIQLRDSGQRDEAERIFADLVREYPENLGVRLVYGGILFHSKRYADALPHFQRILESKPKSEMASLGFFHSLGKLGRGKEAIKELRRFFSVAGSGKEYTRLLEDISKNILADELIKWLESLKPAQVRRHAEAVKSLLGHRSVLIRWTAAKTCQLHKENRLNRSKAPSSKGPELFKTLFLDLTVCELLQPRHDLQGKDCCKALLGEAAADFCNNREDIEKIWYRWKRAVSKAPQRTKCCRHRGDHEVADDSGRETKLAATALAGHGAPLISRERFCDPGDHRS